MENKNLSTDGNSDEIDKLNEECERLKALDESEVEPFNDVSERFQWRVTATYYMCKFAIQVK